MTEHLSGRIESLLDRLERLLTADSAAPDWSAHAFRWRRSAERGRLQAVPTPHRVALEDLLCLDRQKEEIVRNTRQFLAGGGANNLLLWGPRGTGKSSLVKAVFTAYRDAGLRLIEIDKDDLIQLPEILEVVGDQCDRAEGPWEPVEHAALQWALRRGSRSGRTAWQFARDWVGRSQLEGCPT